MGHLISEPQVIELGGTDDLIKYINSKMITRDYRYGYRGHSDSSWSLESTLARYVKNVVLKRFPERQSDRNILESVARRLESKFKSNLIVNEDLPQSEAQSIDVFQFGQHFGLPSPLIDWTYSPFIALFFALSNEEPNKKCIWQLNLDLLGVLNNQIRHDIWPKYDELEDGGLFMRGSIPDLPVVGDLHQANRRIVFQQGFFTRLSSYNSIEIWARRVVEEIAHNACDVPLLRKYNFQCDSKDRLRLLDYLDSMNINNRALFPDVMGTVLDTMDHVLREFQNPLSRNFTFTQKGPK